MGSKAFSLYFINVNVFDYALKLMSCLQMLQRTEGQALTVCEALIPTPVSALRKSFKNLFISNMRS